MGFEERAQGWLAWARTPGHDAYWTYRDAFFALVPAPGAATLEVGCGEGRVARDLVARGHRVTGLDASPTLLRRRGRGRPRQPLRRGPGRGAALRGRRLRPRRRLQQPHGRRRHAGRGARGRARPRAGRAAVRVHHASDADREPRGTTRTTKRRWSSARPISSGAGWTWRSSATAWSSRSTAGAIRSRPTRARSRTPGCSSRPIREPADPAGGRWARVPMFLMWRALKAR